uniref:Adenosine kinase n=1 Tax=Timema cristinae TaxID=61476 RepID=A0A7R9DQ22_TIMCR|nr:unnamed protein product [Timema cristinae]
MEKLRENKFTPVLAAFGNPLLDIYAKINSTDILEKYGLELDGAREIPNNELSRALFQEVCGGREVYLNAGGSAQNTARIFQWLVGPQHCCVYFGSIGSDEEGTLVETLLRRSGVHTRYTYHRNLPTGRCLALVHGEHRSLVANIGAARIYAPHHLNTQDNLKVLSQVKIIYIEGFFIANNFLTAKELIHFCQAKSIILAFNLSSAYICKENPNQVKELLKSADIIFGNEDEYKTLSDTLELGVTGLRDIVEIVRDLNHMHPHIIGKKGSSQQLLKKYGKIVVMTRAKNDVLCAHKGIDSILEIKVPKVDKHLIKNTTGAGDSFVSGFLAGLLDEQCVETCVKWGCWTACQIIQQPSVQPPNVSPKEIKKIR